MKRTGAHKLMNRHPIYALIIGSLMVPAVALAFMADRALAAEPQMPEDFQGRWCGSLKSHLYYDRDPR